MILVPTDFSKQAKVAADVAIGIAKKLGGEVVLLHVIEGPESSSYSVMGEVIQHNTWEDKLFTMKLIESSKEKLGKEVSRISESGIKVVSELRMGNSFHSIQQVIVDHKAYLVIMGTEGHSRLQEIMGESTTEKVMHHSYCPVLTIHEKPASTDFTNIVFAVSLVKQREPSSLFFNDFQKSYNADLNMVWVNTPEVFRPDYESLKLLQQLADEKDCRDYTLHVYNDYTVEGGILSFAEFIGADLIAMATHELSGFGQLLAGNVAGNVSRKSKRPVLTWLVR